MNNLLKETFLNHTQKVSDKWNSYVEAWDRIFDPYRNSPVNLFEIGIQNGGSLEVWANYFKNALNIVGCDIDERCRALSFDDPRISMFVGDSNSDDIKEKVLVTSPKYDIIIDDGSHKSSDVILSFSKYFPALEIGGIYLVEDLHTSYWQDYEGGLFNPNSSMSFFKHLIDIINHEHWRNNQSRVDFLTEFSRSLNTSFTEADLLSINSIEFQNSVCVIKKCRPDENVLGKRIVVGTLELVTKDLAMLNGTHIHDFTVAIKDDSDLSTPKLVKVLQSANQSIESLYQKLEEKELAIGYLDKELAEIMQVTEVLRENLTEREQAVNKLKGDLAERNQTLDNLTLDLADRNQAVEKLTDDLSKRNQTLDKLIGDLAERDQAVNKLEAALTESQNELVQYVQSTSWKLTKPLRIIGRFLKGNKDDPDITK